MKRICALILVIVLLLSLVGCGKSLTSGDLIGTWSGSWEFDGANINCSIEFERDGTFSKLIYHDNNLDSIDEGTYTINGKTVELQSDVDHAITEYKYSGGNLTNNGHSMSKE